MEQFSNAAPFSAGASDVGSHRNKSPRSQKGRGKKVFDSSEPYELGESESSSPPDRSHRHPSNGRSRYAAPAAPAVSHRAFSSGAQEPIHDEDRAASSPVAIPDLSRARQSSTRRSKLGRVTFGSPPGQARPRADVGAQASSFPPARSGPSPQGIKSPSHSGQGGFGGRGRSSHQGSSPRRPAPNAGRASGPLFVDDEDEVAHPGLGFEPQPQRPLRGGAAATPPRDTGFRNGGTPRGSPATPNGAPGRGARGGFNGRATPSPSGRGANGHGRGGGNTPGSGGKPRNHKDRYAEHWSAEQTDAAVAAGTAFKGTLRINAHNTREAYVTVPGFKKDVFIDGIIQRNRAFEGDTVVIELVDRKFWRLAKGVKEEAEKLLEDALQQQTKDDDAEGRKIAASVKPLDASRELEELVELGKLPASAAAPLPSVAAEVEELDDEDHEDDEAAFGADDSFAAPESQPPSGAAESLDARMASLSVGKSAGTPNRRGNHGRSRVQQDHSHRPDEELQPAGRVVAITESNHLTEQIGFVRPLGGHPRCRPNDRVCEFSPMDPRVPRILVPIGQIPDFYKEPQIYAKKLVVVQLVEWHAHSFLPFGRYCQILGEAGEIPAETETLLRMTKVDYRDFRREILESLPQGEYVIPQEEIARRRDFRKTRLFTIDPSTAKDLDDALSIQRLPDGNFEVGVHIADVSFFVNAGTDLDIEAQRRSTSVYLVQKVIPMLPQLLCENLCSLNPAVDRLAFSVVWTLTPNGDILKEWFGRSVIRSCTKLPYDVAQLVIEGKIRDEKGWHASGIEAQFKQIRPVDGHTIDGVIQDILDLQSIAVPLRRDRFQGGSLSITNVKLSFSLDEQGNPYDTWTYITKEANWLVEEFMLLANRRVAERIVAALPESSLLRNHPPPLPSKLEAFGKFCADLKIPINTSSGRALSESLKKVQSTTPPQLYQLLQIMLVRPMQLAKYFCTGDLEIEAWTHYALNMDRYTHFTSPIRRYPDIIVHRQLQAALSIEQVEKQQLDVFSLEGVMATLPQADRLVKICEHANEKKLNARRARELSDKLYLCLMLKDKPVVVDAMAVGLGDKFITVILPKYGLERRLYMEDLGTKKHEYEPLTSTLTLIWPGFQTYSQLPGRAPPSAADAAPPPPPPASEPSVTQKVNILSTFKVQLRMMPDQVPIELDDMMLHPDDPRCRQ
eukprot:TRINITY_DN4115_c2_g1_i1.p1 TRINITY_DN4115_c2_g1~~TRINITY_DN4115_c2_g1_i1.p1  ORF type:complete len:1229 (-),score=429.00 TRINITY_DN4115_c2_g1_i1:213-3770(-)